jgi:pimeloyl-ACP methyl ester carboxylesterase
MSNFVIVHCAWWNGWAWHKVSRLLEDAGHRVIVIGQLPSGGTRAEGLGDLAADVALVRQVIDDVGGDVVLAGHSSGGLIVTELAGHPRVRHSVYVSGFWPRPGQRLADIRSEHKVEWASARDGVVQMVDDADIVRDVMAADVDDALFAEIYARRLLESATTFVTPATAPARSHPVTYVVADRDQALFPAEQLKMAARADHVAHIDASHFSPLSRPAELAAILQSV